MDAAGKAGAAAAAAGKKSAAAASASARKLAEGFRGSPPAPSAGAPTSSTSLPSASDAAAAAPPGRLFPGGSEKGAPPLFSFLERSSISDEASKARVRPPRRSAATPRRSRAWSSRRRSSPTLPLRVPGGARRARGEAAPRLIAARWNSGTRRRADIKLKGAACSRGWGVSSSAARPPGSWSAGWRCIRKARRATCSRERVALERTTTVRVGARDVPQAPAQGDGELYPESLSSRTRASPCERRLTSRARPRAGWDCGRRGRDGGASRPRGGRGIRRVGRVPREVLPRRQGRTRAGTLAKWDIGVE